MAEVNNSFYFLDRMQLKAYDFIFSLSIAKEALSNKNSNNGIIIIGMIIVIVGLVGFIITKNKN